jgi:hypothetical protein
MFVVAPLGAKFFISQKTHQQETAFLSVSFAPEGATTNP